MGHVGVSNTFVNSKNALYVLIYKNCLELQRGQVMSLNKEKNK